MHTYLDAYLGHAGYSYLSVLACCLVFAGCDGGFVSISFAVPDAYQDQVESVVIEVIVPPETDGFGCNDVAFGDISAETLSANTAAEITTVDQGQVSLEGIPREGTKLILARALDSQTQLVAAACAEVGEVSGTVSVTLEAEPATIVTATDVPLGRPLPSTVTVSAIDVLANPVRGAPVQWILATAAATASPSFSTGSSTTDDNGDAMVEVPAPSLAGPTLLDIDVRWERVPVASLQGFSAANEILSEAILDEGANLLGVRSIPTEFRYQVGQIGPAGEMGFAVLMLPKTGDLGPRVKLAYYDAAAPTGFRISTTPPIVGVYSLGLIRSSGRDQVISISQSHWIEITPSPSGTANVDFTPLTPEAPGRAEAIVPVSSCDSKETTEVLAQFRDAPFHSYSAGGTETSSGFLVEPMGSRILASGCVGDVSGAEQRVLVFNPETDGLNRFLVDSDGIQQGTLAVQNSGVGFAPSVGSTIARLLGTQLSIGGTFIGRYLIVKAATQTTAELTDQQDIASVSLSTAGGRVDADNTVDIISLINVGVADDSTRYRVFVALGLQYEGQPVIGITDELQGLRPRAWLVDFDQDGVDEMLIGSLDSARIFDLSSTAK